MPVAQAAPSQKCAQARGKTLVADAVTRVYRRTGGGTYACALPGGRSLSLGDRDTFPDLAAVSAISVAGGYVGYSLLHGNRTGTDVTVRVINTRRRGGRSLAVDDQQPGDVGSLVMTSAGTVAWTVRRTDGVKRIWIAARTARPKLVADSAGIDAASLALGHSRLFWMQDGAPQTAAL